jgi:hypothetical protein
MARIDWLLHWTSAICTADLPTRDVPRDRFVSQVPISDPHEETDARKQQGTANAGRMPCAEDCYALLC